MIGTRASPWTNLVLAAIFALSGAGGAGGGERPCRPDLAELLRDETIEPGRVAELIAAGADVNRRDAAGMTPLMVAAALQDGMRTWIGRGYPEPRFVDLLLKAGASVNDAAHDEFGNSRTALIIAVVENRNPRVAHALLSAGADVEARDETGATALYHAVESVDDPLMIRLLLAFGADPNAANDVGVRPLHRALRSRDTLEAAFILVDAGADVIAQDGVEGYLFDMDEEEEDEYAPKIAALRQRAARRDAGGGVSVMPVAEVEALLAGPAHGRAGALGRAPYFAGSAPVATLRRGNAKWLFWTPGAPSAHSTADAGRLFIDGTEVIGKAGDRIACDLGEFAWHYAHGERTRPWQPIGWLPVMDPDEFAARKAKWLAESRARLAGFVPTEGKTDGDCRWRQYRDRRGRLYGELFVDGEWRDGDGLAAGVSRLECRLGEFEWHGDDPESGLSGWLSANPLLRHGLDSHIVELRTPAEDIRLLLDWGADPRAEYPARLDALPEGTRLDPYHAGLIAAARREEGGAPGEPWLNALDLALLHHRDPEVIRALVFHPGNFEPGGDGNRILDKEWDIPTSTMFAAWYADDPELIRILVSAGDEFLRRVEYVDIDGETAEADAPIWAVQAGNVEAHYLLDIAAGVVRRGW